MLSAVWRKDDARGLSAEDGLEPPDRRWAMLAIMLGILLSGLDSSIASPFMPDVSSSSAQFSNMSLRVERQTNLFDQFDLRLKEVDVVLFVRRQAFEQILADTFLRRLASGVFSV